MTNGSTVLLHISVHLETDRGSNDFRGLFERLTAALKPSLLVSGKVTGPCSGTIIPVCLRLRKRMDLKECHRPRHQATAAAHAQRRTSSKGLSLSCVACCIAFSKSKGRQEACKPRELQQLCPADHCGGGALEVFFLLRTGRIVAAAKIERRRKPRPSRCHLSQMGCAVAVPSPRLDGRKGPMQRGPIDRTLSTQLQCRV